MVYQQIEMIKDMLEKADKQGLITEVVIAFAGHMENGKQIQDACKSALYEVIG